MITITQAKILLWTVGIVAMSAGIIIANVTKMACNG